MTPRDAGLLSRIQGLKADHPFGGYRRLWAYVHVVAGLSVNKTRVLRMMREYNLLVKPNATLNAKRTPSRRTPRPTIPDEWWGLEMTKVMVEGFGGVDIVLVLDGYTKTIVGYDAGGPCTARHWRAALDLAVSRQCPAGTRDQGLSLRRDTGGQPTAGACLKACRTVGM